MLQANGVEANESIAISLMNSYVRSEASDNKSAMLVSKYKLNTMFDGRILYLSNSKLGKVSIPDFLEGKVFFTDEPTGFISK